LIFKGDRKLKNLGYLFAAYSVVWLVLFGYVWSLQRRIFELERKIERLRVEKEKED